MVLFLSLESNYCLQYEPVFTEYAIKRAPVCVVLGVQIGTTFLKSKVQNLLCVIPIIFLRL